MNDYMKSKIDKSNMICQESLVKVTQTPTIYIIDLKSSPLSANAIFGSRFHISIQVTLFRHMLDSTASFPMNCPILNNEAPQDSITVVTL